MTPATSSSENKKRCRLAIIAGHPVQYVAPWLEQLSSQDQLDIHVFYLWDFGVVKSKDPGFGISLEWDIPMLDGYSYSFVRNYSRDPGNHHFLGYINPGLSSGIHAWKPDVILLMNYAFLSYFLLLADPRLWKVPIIFRGDSHDVGRRPSFRGTVGKMLRRLIFSRFSAFLDVGQNNRQYLFNSGVPSHRLFSAPHAIDNQRFQEAKSSAEVEACTLRERLGLDGDQILISFVGKLIPIKRPFDLLHAFAELPDELRNRAYLLFVGEGSLRPSLQETGRHIETLRFLEFQNQKGMPSIYAASDLLVLPSQSETWGLVVNEAMNLSCPALVSDNVGCAPDLIIPDVTGWVFPTGDRAALRDRLAAAIREPDHLRRMGIQAAAHINAFSFDNLNGALLDALDRVTGSRFQPSRQVKSPRTDA